MISGTTALVAHMGYPTHTFKSPLICNPWFEKNGVDAVVVPMGIKAEDYPDFFRSVFTLTNIRGALVTMPHKVTTMELVDEISPTAEIAGATQRRSAAGGRVASRRSVRRRRFCPRRVAQGIRPVRETRARCRQRRRRFTDRGRSGGPRTGRDRLVRSARAASEALAQRIGKHYPDVKVAIGSKDPEGYDLIVNATPIGMKDGDPLPVDIDRITPGSYVGDVVLKADITPFLQAAKDKGCTIQVGQRHAVRADSRLPGVLRLRQRHTRRIARNCAAVVVTEGYLT